MNKPTEEMILGEADNSGIYWIKGRIDRRGNYELLETCAARWRYLKMLKLGKTVEEAINFRVVADRQE